MVEKETMIFVLPQPEPYIIPLSDILHLESCFIEICGQIDKYMDRQTDKYIDR